MTPIGQIKIYLFQYCGFKSSGESTQKSKIETDATILFEVKLILSQIEIKTIIPEIIYSLACNLPLFERYLCRGKIAQFANPDPWEKSAVKESMAADSAKSF